MAGLAGAGKTTAIRLLERRGVGARFYVGAFVTSEVERLSLEAGPASERRVRTELRARDGMDALARAALPDIESAAEQGAALIDAVHCEEERSLYRQRFGDDLAIVAIETLAEVRAARLAVRHDRPMTTEEQARRDALELGRFGLGQVLRSADRRISNEGTLDELEGALERALSSICGRAPSRLATQERQDAVHDARRERHPGVALRRDPCKLLVLGHRPRIADQLCDV